MEENSEVEESKKDVVKQLFVTAFKHKKLALKEKRFINSLESVEGFFYKKYFPYKEIAT